MALAELALRDKRLDVPELTDLVGLLRVVALLPDQAELTADPLEATSGIGLAQFTAAGQNGSRSIISEGTFMPEVIITLPAVPARQPAVRVYAP